jgi:hypothetical protein
MEQAACLYFCEQADPSNGQVLDRAINKTSTGELDPHFVSSIAATRFGLTALCISDKRSYYPTDRLKKQVITTLDFHLNQMPNEHGFFYHFNDVKTGKPLIYSEVSSIDTAILMCGVLTARAYFNDPKITDLATQLYNRVDWPWMLNGGKTFSMGWRPETGFISTRWDHYSELMMLYLLAIGSPTHPISPDCWSACASNVLVPKLSRFVIPTGAKRSGEPALSEVEWGSAVCIGQQSCDGSQLCR